MSFSRRDFVRTIVLSTGAVFIAPGKKSLALAAPSPLARTLDYKRAHEWLRSAKRNDPPQTEDPGTDVVVIGGGPAGLATAWALRQQNVGVKLLETETTAGGTLRSAKWNDIPYPLGSTFFVRYSDDYKNFYQSIGATPIETGEDALWVKDYAINDWWNPSIIAALPWPTRDIDMFRKFRDVLQAMTKIPKYPLTHARGDDLVMYDKMSAEDYLDSYGSSRLSRTMDLYCRSVMGGTAEEVNAYSLLNFYAFEFGDSFSLPCYTFSSGLAPIAERAVKSLGSSVMTGCLVTSVQQTAPGKVEVIYRSIDGVSHRIKAKAAVVTSQKRIAAEIVRGLPDDRVEAMKKIRYAPYVTVALCSKQQLWPSRGFDFWFDDKQNRFTDVIDVTSPVDAIATRQTSGFVYMLSSMRPTIERERLQQEDYQVQLAQELVNALNEHVPGIKDKLEEVHIFTWGHSLVVPTVGSHTELHPLVAPPFGDIHFANADNDLAPGIENALGAAFDASRAVIAKL